MRPHWSGNVRTILSSFAIALHPPVRNDLWVTSLSHHLSFLKLDIPRIPEHIVSVIPPFNSCFDVTVEFPHIFDIPGIPKVFSIYSVIVVSLYSASLIIIFPILVVFEEVSLAVSLPSENCVHVCEVLRKPILSNAPRVNQISS